ncbi:MAG: hypothetical protein KatS3mg023_3882 [Armatimonadota bacterium]|nr:MAG: hypothetical protein KatS3mg023_3882 [Armatimonadota bacterium]
MAVIRGQQYVLHFYAYNSDGTPKTGDASNITVRISKDGGALTATTNTPAEVDATNAPGVYRITLTATEMDANSILVAPKSSTTGVQCTVTNIITERGRLDATVSSRASSSEVGAVPANVWNYTPRTLNADVTIDMTQVLPASPASNTVGDALKKSSTNLDATVSSRSTLTAADVWNYTTRTLTSFGTLVSDTANAVWSASTRTLTSFGTLANDVATAVWGYTTRTLTSFGTLTTDTANAVWGYTTRTLTGFGTLVNDVATAVWAMVIDGGKSAMGLMRLFAAALLGKVSGAQTNTPVFRDIADTKNRITMTVDNDGNRTGVTLDDS